MREVAEIRRELEEFLAIVEQEVEREYRREPLDDGALDLVLSALDEVDALLEQWMAAEVLDAEEELLLGGGGLAGMLGMLGLLTGGLGRLAGLAGVAGASATLYALRRRHVRLKRLAVCIRPRLRRLRREIGRLGPEVLEPEML